MQLFANMANMERPPTPPDADEVILVGNQAFQHHDMFPSDQQDDLDEQLQHVNLEQKGESPRRKKSKRLHSRISIHDVESIRNQDVLMDNFQRIMENNLAWSEQIQKTDSKFFQKLKIIQTPQYLWIGCSDSRVPANQVVGLKPGQLFVHRNIANQAPLSDVNALAVIQYAVEFLQVKDIIVCGHYGCGGIKAAFKKQDHGPLESWLSYVRNLRARFRKQFTNFDQKENENLLVELNVKHNVENIARVPIVQKTWKQGRQLRIHGLVYQLKDGILHDLDVGISSLEQLPEQYKIY